MKKKALNIDNEILINNLYKNSKIIKIITLVLFALFTIPFFRYSIQSRLDLSWIYLVNISNYRNLIFGKDIFFTYGPLGFILCPMNVGVNRIISNIVYMLFFLITLAIVYKCINRNIYLLFIFVMIIGFPLFNNQWNYLLFFLSLMGGASVTISLKKYAYPLLCLLSSVLLLMKFDVAVMAILIVCIATFVNIFNLLFTNDNLNINKKKNNLFRIGFYLLGGISIPVLSCVWYLIYDFNITDLKNYFFTSILISSYYNSAMTLSGSWVIFLRRVLPFVIIIVIFLGLVLFYKNKGVVRYFVIFPIVLLGYKYTIVRCDGYHSDNWPYFMRVTAFLLVLLRAGENDIIDEKKRKNDKLIDVAIFFLILYCYNLYIALLFIFIYIVWRIVFGFKKIRNTTLIKTLVYSALLAFILFSEYALNNIIVYKKDYYLKGLDDYDTVENHSLPEELIGKVGDSSVTFFPCTIIYLEYYDLNFTPLPIPQAYVAFSPELDSLNYNFLNSDCAPEFIVFEEDTIDYRKMEWESPLTNNAIINNYYLVDTYDGIKLLKKKSGHIDCNPICKKTVRQSIYEPICISDSDMEYNAISINVSPKSFKGIKQTMYCIEPVYMNIKYREGREYKYRVLVDQLSSPLLLYDDTGIFDANRIDYIQFVDDALFNYKEEIEINYYIIESEGE